MERQRTVEMCANSLYPYANGLSKSLAECLCLAHLHGENLAPGQSGEGCISTKRLGNTWIKKKSPLLQHIKAGSLPLIKLDLKPITSWESNTMTSRGRQWNYIVFVKPPWPSPIAIAVFPVPGCPAIRTAFPAMWPSLIISRMSPAARREASWPTIPWDTCKWTGMTCFWC